jgi:predicted acetylornithine/succinylornithine family transaminase/N-acetyl-ornithine/N-acetyl-lysine deacetylase
MSPIIDIENTYTSGVYGKRQIAIVRGKDALLWDADGHEYIDCAGGHGVANIGHGRTEIAAVLAAQAQRLITCPEIFYNDVRARLLERLAQITPEGITNFFLCNSGTEAVEGALKFARLATGRTGIVATLRGFHGRTMGALSTTWEPHYREPFTPLIPNVTHIRYNNIEAAQSAITDETAAVIIELVQGEGGVHIAHDQYVRELAALCRERGALLIVDEVQTAFGRTGRLFACEHYDVQPDILCLAKSLAGGVPMGAIGLGQRVMEGGRIAKGVHGSTFGGNPLACAAALATLDILEQEKLAERAVALGGYALERLQAINSPLIREVRGRGLLIGIELNRRVQPYLEALCERGVLALPAGPNVLRLLPPLVITEEQLKHVIDVIEELLIHQSNAKTQNTLSTGNSLPEKVGTPVNYQYFASAGGTSANNALVGNVSIPIDYADHAYEVELLQSMLAISSLSRQESTLAHYLVEQARLMGLHAYVDEAGNFVASTHQQLTDVQPIVLLGHMDTVPGNIPVRLEEGVLYGRGAVDAKGPLAAFICATARVARSKEMARPIVVIGAVEEEAATSRGARFAVQQYQPYACIIGEPSGSQAVTIGYKGRLLVNGNVSRSLSHTAGPLKSSNEIAAAFWEKVRRHASEWNELHAGNSAFASLQPSLRSINSGQDGLEEWTRFLIGYRLPPSHDIAALQSRLAHWAHEDDINISFSGEEVAYQSTRTTPLARAFIMALRSTGVQPTFKNKTGTSDMNVVGPIWGQNIVAYGPGDSSLDHTPQEHIHIKEYKHAIDVLELVLRGLGQ